VQDSKLEEERERGEREGREKETRYQPLMQRNGLSIVLSLFDGRVPTTRTKHGWPSGVPEHGGCVVAPSTLI